MARKGSNAVDIDENNLVTECLDHPRATLDAHEDEADAKHELAKANERLAVTEADLQLSVRETPEKFNLPKDMKEAGIKAAVMLHKDYRTAVQEVNDAQHRVHLCTAMVKGLEDKRRMIERIIELKQIDYWSEPRPRGTESRAAVANGTKEVVRTGVKRPRERDDG